MEGFLFKYLSYYIYLFKNEADYYVPLPLIYGISGKEIVEFPGIAEAYKKTGRFLLTGPSGSGKSTALKHLFLTIAEQCIADIFIRHIPVFISPQSIDPSEKESNLENLIIMSIRAILPDLNPETSFSDIFKDKDILLIIDGIEVIRDAIIKSIEKDLSLFLKKHPDTHIVLSAGDPDYISLRIPAYYLKPMTNEIITEYIQRYSLKQGMEPENSIKILSKYTLSLFSSPFYLNILLEAESAGKEQLEILNRGMVLQKYFQIRIKTLFPKVSSNRITKLMHLLSIIAFSFHMRGEYCSSKELVWSLIYNYIAENDSDFRKADKFLYQLIKKNILKESNNLISFPHHLYQEFFAGFYLANNNMSEFLTAAATEWWDGSFRFYLNLTDNPSDFINNLYKQGKIYYAMEYILESRKCNEDLRISVCSSLLENSTGGFEFNRIRSKNLLQQLDTSLIETLIRKTGNNDHKAILRSLKKSKPGEKTILENSPGLYDTTEFNRTVIFLKSISVSEDVHSYVMNLCRNKKKPLKIRRDAILSLRCTGSEETLTFLNELTGDCEPEISDAAFKTKYYLERRIRRSKRLFQEESGSEFTPEIVFDSEYFFPASARIIIEYSHTGHAGILIAGHNVSFGPVAGRTFQVLARCSERNRIVPAAEIAGMLRQDGLYLNEKSIIRKVHLIRRKIRKVFEGRIDPFRFIETVRKKGYIINAEIIIEEN
ncbi:NACHT domain-containing protein [candidate division KSB1 bacterium]